MHPTLSLGEKDARIVQSKLILISFFLGGRACIRPINVCTSIVAIIRDHSGAPKPIAVTANPLPVYPAE